MKLVGAELKFHEVQNDNQLVQVGLSEGSQWQV